MTDDVLPFPSTILACDRCGRLLTDPDTGTSLYGCRLSLSTPLEQEAIFQRLYPELPPAFSLTLCWVCWLASLGLTPEQVTATAARAQVS